MEILSLLIPIASVVLIVASLWKVYTKAGEPGWACIVPIYNIIVLLKIAKKPMWYLILLLIPFINTIMLFVVYIAIAKNFGKGAGFGVGLALLGFIFFPILAFGDAKYIGEDNLGFNENAPLDANA